MEAGNLARWIEELDAAIERLQKRVDKIVAGGGFDPSTYIYTTPFMDVVSDPITVQAADDGITSYVATEDCYTVSSVFCADYDAHIDVYSPGPDNTWIDSVIMYEEPAGSGPHKFVFPLKAGQKIKILSPDSAGSGTAIHVYPLITSQLQEAPAGLLGRIARTIKKAFKGGD